MKHTVYFIHFIHNSWILKRFTWSSCTLFASAFLVGWKECCLLLTHSEHRWIN